MINQYKYIERVGPFFDIIMTNIIGRRLSISELGTAHGDKADQYNSVFQEMGITFESGVLVYLLSYELPFSKQVRDTENGWVDVSDWLKSVLSEKYIKTSLEQAYNTYMSQLYESVRLLILDFMSSEDDCIKSVLFKDIIIFVYNNAFKNVYNKSTTKSVYTDNDYFLYGELNVVTIDNFTLFYNDETKEYGVCNHNMSLDCALETIVGNV